VFDKATLNRLYRYCCSLRQQPSDAFDLLQTGVERCLRSPPRSGDASYSYAIKVIRNLYIDEYRREGRIQQEEFDEARHSVDYDISSLDTLAIDRSELEEIWKVLSLIEREILFLWAVEGYSTTEVARHLEKPRNTVLSIIYRMRNRLVSEGYSFRSRG
jgi:RNA polymerase sigma-70 factor (ECF subfamily)